MHSKKALNSYYPGLAKALPLYYGQAELVGKDSSIDWAYLDSLDLLKGNDIAKIEE